MLEINLINNERSHPSLENQRAEAQQGEYLQPKVSKNQSRNQQKLRNVK